IHQENVGIAVIVIVDESATRTHGFRQPLLSERAVVVSEVDACLRGDVAKMNLLREAFGWEKKHNPPQRHRGTEKLQEIIPLVFSASLCLCGELPFSCVHYLEPPAEATDFPFTAASGTETCSCTACRSLLSSGCDSR